jgi:hypothetical protein
MNGF